MKTPTPTPSIPVSAVSHDLCDLDWACTRLNVHCYGCVSNAVSCSSLAEAYALSFGRLPVAVCVMSFVWVFEVAVVPLLVD